MRPKVVYRSCSSLVEFLTDKTRNESNGDGTFEQRLMLPFVGKTNAYGHVCLKFDISSDHKHHHV